MSLREFTELGASCESKSVNDSRSAGFEARSGASASHPRYLLQEAFSLENDAIRPIGSVLGRWGYEIKFLVSTDTADQVLDWARNRMVADPHSEPELGDGYHVSSLYLDTEGLDVFHKSPSFRRDKYRVRRYGASPTLFLERKTRVGDKVRKRRFMIDASDVSLIAGGDGPQGWTGEWFADRVARKGLKPQCLMSYVRTALVGSECGQPLRLTVDREIRSARTDETTMPLTFEADPVLPGQAVLELKYETAFPAVFKTVVGEFLLQPGAVSKYQWGMRKWVGVDDPGANS